MKLIVTLILLCPCILAQQQSTAGPMTRPPAEEHIRQLMESLPPNSAWRSLLERGMKGNGVHEPWMDQMRKQRVKLAILTFEFNWTKKGRELKNWRLASEQYFGDYDRVDLITEPARLAQINTSNLGQELADVALPRAKTAHWFERPRQHRGLGYKQIWLADNEWLPVTLGSEWLGRYEPGTTPLMHAALLGDVARMRKLLAEGAGVDALGPDGSTALIYAAASDNPAAVETLLEAGADVTSRMKGGGEALITAVAGGNLRSVGLLLKAGADPNSRGPEGERALSIAIQRHYADVAKLLRQAGAHE